MSDTIGCLTPGCGKICESRGLCPRCYTRLRRRVLARETTWEALEQEGLCLPGNRGASKWVREGRTLAKKGT